MSSRTFGHSGKVKREMAGTWSDPTAGYAIASADSEEPEDDYDPVLMHWVYFALDPDSCQVKIGTTNNVQRRLGELRGKRPNLELLGTARAGYKYERMLHRRFAPYRREGEWFSSEIVGELQPLIDL